MGKPQIPYATRSAGWLHCNPPPSKMGTGHSLSTSRPGSPPLSGRTWPVLKQEMMKQQRLELLLEEDLMLIHRKCPDTHKGAQNNSRVTPAHRKHSPKMDLNTEHANICFQVFLSQVMMSAKKPQENDCVEISHTQITHMSERKKNHSHLWAGSWYDYMTAGGSVFW